MRDLICITTGVSLTILAAFWLGWFCGKMYGYEKRRGEELREIENITDPGDFQD